MKTPRSDELEKSRIEMNGGRCPAYGDALRRLKRYENALWKIREANSRDTTIDDAKRIATNSLDNGKEIRSK
jgi:hypothetical protein